MGLKVPSLLRKIKCHMTLFEFAAKIWRGRNPDFCDLLNKGNQVTILSVLWLRKLLNSTDEVWVMFLIGKNNLKQLYE